MAQGLEPNAGFEHEKPAVPQVLPTLNVPHGGGSVGFFYKGFNGADVSMSTCGAGLVLYVAVAGFGPVRHDAEGDHRARSGGGQRFGHGSNKCGLVGHHMVCGHGQQHGVLIRVAGQCLQGGECQGRGGVAARGFEHDVARRYAGLLQLAGHQKAGVVVRHQYRRGGNGGVVHQLIQPIQAQGCVLQQTVGTAC